MLALVALPILLLRMLVEHDLPMNLFFYADGLGTVAILAVASMAIFGREKKPGSDSARPAPGPS